MKSLSAAALGIVLFACLGACAGEPIGDDPCPPGGTTLTYEDFGEEFFAEWCVRCHGGPNGYSSRSFTTLADIQAESARIFINAAAGNAFMPPGPDGPSREERDELATWLACGAP
jgi:mono/diheme cytochrome c family protein